MLVGPSGCGKSTLLRMLAGLEDITGGEIPIDGQVVNDLESKDRDIAMVFQSYALYPHMTVGENMAFSLRLRKADKALTDERVANAAKILNLDPLLERYPRELSGGQRQRVAMGRAIVRDPKVFLFDEPLSNLDAKLRVAMRAEIKALHQRLKTTTVYVTHDQIEAMTMADRIVVMHDGSDRADRHAARALRPAGQPVRRAVHRLAGDERADRHAARAAAASAWVEAKAACAGRCAAERRAATARPCTTACGPSDLASARRRGGAGQGDRGRAHRRRDRTAGAGRRRADHRRDARPHRPSRATGSGCGRDRRGPPVRSGERRRAHRLRQIRLRLTP